VIEKANTPEEVLRRQNREHSLNESPIGRSRRRA
jgi:hypothetical protein